MTLLFGGGGQKKPQITGLQVQTSTNALPVPIIYGKTRAAPNLIWYGDFKSQKVKQGKGKVSKKGGGSYTYSASIVMALCEGEIQDITFLWRNKEEIADYTTQGFNLFVGSDSQSPWSYLTTNHPTEALSYPGVAYLAVANYPVGEQAAMQSHSFEVEALLVGTQAGGNGDADPAQIIDDFLTQPRYGAGFPSTGLDNSSLYSGPDAGTTGDSAYQTYCRAIGFGLSPLLSDAAPAAEILERWAMLTNSALVWSGSSLKFIPYGDEEITGNGVTFLPPTTVRAALSDDDFMASPGEEGVTVSRSDPADAFNVVKLEAKDRADSYNLKPVEAKDQSSIEALGEREMQIIRAHEICELDMASRISYLILQRKVYIRNEYRFKLSWEHCLLEPMDVVTITSPQAQLNAKPVRIVSVEEDDDGLLSFVAEDFISGTGTAGAYTPQPSANTPVNTAALPGDVNTPVFYEPPVSQLTNNVRQLWIAASGASAQWGGCTVWASLDMGASYQLLGKVQNASVMGTLTSTLPTYGGSNPDTINTLEVDVLDSRGDLGSFSAEDAEAGVSLCLAGNELLSYELATLTSPGNYDLDNLYRGLFGTSPGAQASGQPFVFYNGSEIRFDLPDDTVGVAVYFKFTSFNLFGISEQSLADVTEYIYTPAGGGVPQPPSGVSASGAFLYNQITWDPSPSAGITGYRIYAVEDPVGVFGSATVVGTVSAAVTSFQHVNLLPGEVWRYWVTAYSIAGESSPAGPINATVLSRTPTVFFGNGEPSDLDGENGDIYYDIDEVPFKPWVKYMGSWETTDRSGPIPVEAAEAGTTYNFAADDFDSMKPFTNAGGITATIPTNASVPCPVGTRLFVLQQGTGQVTIAGAMGVTLQSRGARLKTTGQYSLLTAIKMDTDTWVVGGDITS